MKLVVRVVNDHRGGLWADVVTAIDLRLGESGTIETWTFEWLALDTVKVMVGPHRWILVPGLVDARDALRGVDSGDYLLELRATELVVAERP